MSTNSNDNNYIKPAWQIEYERREATAIKLPEPDEPTVIWKDGKEVSIKSLFPVNSFPESVQQIINETNKCLNFPIDFIGSSILYAAALSIGNTYRVRIKDSWEEGATVFIANVGRPNANKSHPVSFALRPIFARDAKTYREYQEKKMAYDKYNLLPKKERPQDGKDEVMKPIWEKFIVDDFTPEVLAEVHKYNKRGVGVYADELAGWFKNFNRYNKSGEQERWLKIWSGKQITIDRKTSEPTLISSPFIPVIGNIQTGILNELAKDNRVQNGLVDRMLFAFPEYIEKQSISEQKINPDIIENWDNIISKLLSIELKLDENRNPKPNIMHFSKEAWEKFKTWESKNITLCNQTKNEALASIYGKFDIHVFRFALILEMLQWGCSKSGKKADKIGTTAIEGAIKLADYFSNMALRVHKIHSSFNPFEKMPAYKKDFYEDLPDQFKLTVAMRYAEMHQIPDRTVKRILATKELFKKTKWGEYEKIFK